MNRKAARQQLVRDGWCYAVLMVLPAMLVGRLEPLDERFGVVFFALGLAALFLSLACFRAYKHGLIHVEKMLGNDGEADAWAALRRIRLKALMVASLPAWIAAVGSVFGLDEVPRTLLIAGCLVLLVLYKVPRQLH